MEKPEALGAAGGRSGESPGEATVGVSGGITVEADAGPPSSVVPFHGSGPSLHPGGIVTRSPESSRPSGGVAVLGSGPNQHPGEVAHLGTGSGPYPSGLHGPFPETRVYGTYRLGSEGSGAYNSGRSPRSKSTCLHSHKPCEDRPRSILKSNGSVLMQKSPIAEKNKSQRWDEMNILVTYHPADKDYGFMKVDEPSTPYHRLQDSDEDLPGASSPSVTPEVLAKRLAKMDNLYPKVLQYGDTRSLGAPDHFSKTHSSDFVNRRKTHYDEGKAFETQQSFSFDDNKHNNKGGRANTGSDSRGMMLDPEPRPVERGWTGGLARGVNDEIGLVTRNHIREAKGGHKTQVDLDDSADSPAFRNQCRASATVRSGQESGLQQRKEYYIKGRYLRSSPHPELEEDTEDERSANLSWVMENPISTEVRLLGHPGSPIQDHKATKDRLKVTVTKSQPGTVLSSKDNGSRSESGWCQCLAPKGLTWQRPESLERQPGSHRKSPNQNQSRHETLRLQWTQEGEAKQWKT
ncbi:uncharacterized protein LOC125927053 isoform X2 [Panthera uncia]|uniref:uncharacterized protein LOC125927053 isoform X2 n=1 Tax=Panthera uncia TaxID=29064 RepID=UPI0020FFBD45|nr:uncharacterized protein LOC125927053 isoform X2 [Panthera uncia]